MVSLGVAANRDVTHDLRFYWGLLKVGHRLIDSSRSLLLHHVFPLGLWTGFNPAILMQPRCPVVVGPLLYQPSDDRSDERLVEAAEGRNAGLLATPTIRPFPSIMRSLHRATLRNSHVVLFDCETTREQMISEDPKVASYRYRILPGGGVHHGFLEAGLDRTQGIQEDAPLRVGTVATLRSRKRVHLLLAALQGFDQRQIRCDIAGSGPSLPNLLSQVAKLDLGRLVTFRGRLPWSEVPGFLASLDAVFSLDRVPHEAQALVQEAMMCGCGVIVAGPRALSDPEILPYGFDIGSSDDIVTLRTILESLVRDRTLARRLGERAREHAMSKFSEQAVARALRDAYREASK